MGNDQNCLLTTRTPKAGAKEILAGLQEKTSGYTIYALVALVSQGGAATGGTAMAHMDAADFEAEGMAIGTTARQVLQALEDPENLTMIAYEVKYFIIELATTSQRWRRPGSTPPMSVVGTWAFDERELEDALRAAAEVRRAMRDNGRPDAGALETLKEKLEPLADAAVARD